MKSELDGVLVTGGAKGIGKAISLHLASHGWAVTACGRDKGSLDALGAMGIRSIALDLSAPSAADVLAADWERSGLPRALVCNAANYGELGRLADVDFDAWKSSFELNFFSVGRILQQYLRLAAREALPGGTRRKIVVLGGGGLGGAKVWPAVSAYACAKAAISQLVSVIHEEEFAHGIDINCLAPGAVHTGITEQATRAGAATLGAALYEATLKIQEGRGESPELAAVMTAHLLSDACNGVSGRLISAKWDKLLFENPARVAADGDLYRLRRIDDELYRKG